MKFQIKEIVLWPKKSGVKPRRLPFETGSVNVISGASRTGKSAIIPIIDYCLGSDKCSIPVLTIRNACEWFGVVVQTSAGEKLFARREPGSQKSTGDMFVVEAPKVDIPDQITQTNSNVRAVKRTLDELAGLTNLDFDPNDSDASFLSRPSFRDLGPFLFQPQNVVANPDILFYKADRPEHSQKLQTIFPYVLNAVTPELLAKQHELESLKRELRRKKGELATARQVSERWMSEVRAKVTEARELGLIEQPVPQSATQGQLVDLLTQVVARPAGSAHKVTSATVEEAVQEFVSLQTEESQVSMRLSGLRRRLGEMETLRQTSKEFEGALHLQRDRLKISDWLATMHNGGSDCPVCGHAITQAKERLATLCTALRTVEESAGQIGNVPAAFDRELERVKTEIRETTEQLDGIKIRRQAVEKRSSQAQQTYYDSLRVSRFIGNLEQSLQLYSRIGHDSNLENEVKSLEEQVTALEQAISKGAIYAKTQRALASVNLNAGRLIPSLDAERPNDPISLSISDLSIKVKGSDREDFLWEIGSGSNWLSYHVAVTLGLHQFFLALPFSPVPDFVVYDQPSQVYFPVRLAGKATKEEEDPKLKDEDLDAVRKVFSLMADVVKASGNRLQVIVLDHAGSNVWGQIPGINLVEEWRGGKKLVPPEWLS